MTVGVVLAIGISSLVPALGALTIALVLGVGVANTPVLPASANTGLVWATRRLLRAGVVLLGLQLAVGQILVLGSGPVIAVVVTVSLTFVATLGLARLLGLSRGLGVLVGTGFSICGASAIAAVEGVVERDDSDVATAVALVTLYGSLAIAILPMFAGPLGFPGVGYGHWAGLSVHEVAQVVAAASPFGAAAVAAAVVLKLSRVVLLAPLVAGVGLLERRRGTRASGARPPLVPLFVLGFLAMVALRSTGWLPVAVLDASATVTTTFLAAALFGLGTSINLAALVRTGPRALLLGLGSTVVVTVTAGVALTMFAAGS